MTVGRQKSDDEGKKEQNKVRAHGVHWRTLLEDCVGRIVFLSFNLQQIPKI
jgi:hypothetical protein